jgi:exopolysaccharide biosynthesis polyprenyl glycosylphosphotransferase
MNRRLQVTKYVLADIVSAMIAWVLFFTYRKYIFDKSVISNLQEVYSDENLYYGIVLVPVFWLMLYSIVGTYRRIYRKARLKELGQTFLISLIGVLVLFFALILDDEILSYKTYYQSVLVLFSLHFIVTYTFRLIITSITAYKIHNKLIGFRTLLIGSNGNAISIYNEIENQEKSSGNIFVGFVNAKNYNSYHLEEYLDHLGHIEDVKEVIKEHNIEEVIIAIEKSEHNTVERIITLLEDTDVVIKIIPIMQDILVGSVKMSAIFHTPLIQITPEPLPIWQQSVKRLIDIIASSIAILLLLPVYIGVGLAVVLTSKGPMIYSQVRVGINGKPFKMHKFRSMYVNAERMGPQLSSKHDPRITPIGRFLRKVRLDEIPQFFSVLIGDMSLVGPRPERQYFIDQIVQRAPHYRLLHKIKPGITSWGQVKFGYAENVDEMIVRLKYDILYLENMSLAMDLKILIYTAIIVVQGRGK